MAYNMENNIQSLTVGKMKKNKGTYTKMMLQSYMIDRMTEQFHLDQVNRKGNRKGLGNLSPLSEHECVQAAAFCWTPIHLHGTNTRGMP